MGNRAGGTPPIPATASTLATRPPSTLAATSGTTTARSLAPMADMPTRRCERRAPSMMGGLKDVSRRFFRERRGGHVASFLVNIY